DFAGWQNIPDAYADRPFHAHNRLIKCSALSPDERRALTRDIADRLDHATGPVHVLMPTRGIEEWDKPDGPAHDPNGLAAMVDEMQKAIRPPARLQLLDCHINDSAFAKAALAVVDDWLADGTLTVASPT
ncbi:MAG: Tm-1-like ATP-binding domain-containing protein, partial [Pseudomonadota bacterium]